LQDGILTKTSDLPALPPTGRKFLIYFLAFTVTLGIGIGPFLGLIRVPGFISIGELFPLNLQRAVAAFAAFLLTLPAVGVQFFGGDRFDAGRLKAAFAIVSVAIFAGTLALYLAYTSWVVHVEVGGKLSAAYIVGPTMLPDCLCVAAKLQITSCIGPVLDTNPAHVEDCYPREDIVARKNGLSLLYFFAIFSLGVLIGLVVLRERMRPENVAEK
jgi:hypothetical protein